MHFVESNDEEEEKEKKREKRNRWNQSTILLASHVREAHPIKQYGGFLSSFVPSSKPLFIVDQRTKVVLEFSCFSYLMRHHVAVHVEIVLRLRFCETRTHVRFILFPFRFSLGSKDRGSWKVFILQFLTAWESVWLHR